MSQSPTQAGQLRQIASSPCDNDIGQHCDVRRCGIKCFRNCSLSCLDEMNGNPTVVRMTCFLNSCCTAMDAVATSIPNGQSRVHAAASSNQTQDFIAVSGSHKFSFNLTLLRSAGLVFNQFSATASSRRLAECPRRSWPEAISLKVKFDDLIVWGRTFKAVGAFHLILDVPSSVQSLSLTVQQRSHSVKRNPVKDCFAGEWINPFLSHRTPLLPSCYGQCLSSRSHALHLHCLFPVCPGVCAGSDTKNPLIDVEGKGQVCPQCNVTGCPSDKPLARSIQAVTNSTVTFHVDALRRRGYHLSVFRTDVVIEQKDSRLFCFLPVTFRVLLDDKEVQHRTLHVGQPREKPTAKVLSKESDMVVVVSGSDRLTLQTMTTLESACNVTLKWDNPRLVEPLPSPTFVSCSNTCYDELDSGQLYLSCFLGVCDGMVTRSSFLPFFSLNYHHDSTWGPGLGIGANRPGGWQQGKGPIQLTDRHGYVVKFPFGIGAYPDTSITFHLDAFRRHGYKFKHFISTLGINSGSGCSTQQLASVVFRVYADNVMVSNTPIHDIRTAQTILYDVRNTGQLTLVTIAGFKDACHHAVWAGARLTNVRFPMSN